MNVTFLVEVRLNDLSTLVQVAGEIEDDLSETFEVLSVKPWARPTARAGFAALPSLTEPTTTNQQQETPIQ